MKILYKNENQKKPLVSFILIDWSVRHSAHMLEYLHHQDIERDLYEVIWIEYYSKHFTDIEKKLSESLSRSRDNPILDQWIIMEVPDEYHIHKHSMYNTGIIFASGRIAVFCDSDAIVRPTFVSSIINEFDKDKNIVLYMDELRSSDKKLYPFSNPSVESIMKPRFLYSVNGKPEGSLDSTDWLHLKNYGACMCCLRQDAISIGGADEDISCLGYISGPYDPGFRLINAGRREVWSKDEWLYHTWHPGVGGENNYSGPDDGRKMSSTALEAVSSGRIFPLSENSHIRSLRLDGDKSKVTPGFEFSLPIEWRKASSALKQSRIEFLSRVRLRLKAVLLFYIFAFYIKHIFQEMLPKVVKKYLRKYYSPFSGAAVAVNSLINTLKERWESSLYLLGLCFKSLADLKCRTDEIVIFGDCLLAKILCIFAGHFSMRVRGVYSNKPCQVEILSNKGLKNDNIGVIIINSGISNINYLSGQIKKLMSLGIPRDRIKIII